MVMGRLTVSAVPALNDNYVWLIRDPDSGETAAVDPSVAQPVLEAAPAEDLGGPGTCRIDHERRPHVEGLATEPVAQTDPCHTVPLAQNG